MASRSFINNAWYQPTNPGAVIWLCRANDGWAAVSQEWVALLEEVVAQGPPYADVFPPPHHWTGHMGEKGTIQYV